jgi:pimeloyl-ACP methyl ester carboxylesterase
VSGALRRVGRPLAGVAAIALAALAVTCATAASPRNAAAAIEWTSDSLATFEGVARSVDRGTLIVPEDRSKPDSPRIRVGFLRLRSTATKPGAPTLFLAGGPGVPASFMGRVPAYDRLFQRLRSKGDVILLDQRGCGLSDPILVCAPPHPLPADFFASEAKARAELERIYAGCAASLRADGIHPEAYTTRAIAEDVEDLRRALGVPKLDLLAFSYGTELAQEVIRLSGDRVGRAVLVGTRAVDEAWRAPGDFDMFVRRMGRAVAWDSTYAPLAPDLASAIRAAVDTLNARPRTVTVVDRRSGAKVSLTAGGFALQVLLQGDLTDPLGFASTPALLTSLAAGDDTLFATKLGQLYNSLSSIVNVQLVAVDCASGADPDRATRAARESARSLFGGSRTLLQSLEICRAVGAADLGDAYRERVYSTAPTLFLSGAFDGNAPPFQAEEVRWGFPNAIHIVVGNGWHELLPVPDVQQIVADFLAGTDVAGRRVSAPPLRFLSVEEAKMYIVRSR